MRQRQFFEIPGLTLAEETAAAAEVITTELILVVEDAVGMGRIAIE